MNLPPQRSDSNDRPLSGEISPFIDVNGSRFRECRVSGRSGAVSLTRTPRNRPCHVGHNQPLEAYDGLCPQDSHWQLASVAAELLSTILSSLFVAGTKCRNFRRKRRDSSARPPAAGPDFAGQQSGCVLILADSALTDGLRSGHKASYPYYPLAPRATERHTLIRAELCAMALGSSGSSCAPAGGTSARSPERAFSNRTVARWPGARRRDRTPGSR
jgi:hypothetical protein